MLLKAEFIEGNSYARVGNLAVIQLCKYNMFSVQMQVIMNNFV